MLDDLRHVRPVELPMALAGLHRALAPGDDSRVHLPPPDAVGTQRLRDILEGAGLSMRRRGVSGPTRLVRQYTLPDTTASGMTLLIAGLNPSPAAAEAGVGFARPGNRFWPAALAAGLVSRDRDPSHALGHHGVGMTDLVKRTTRQAADLSADEYRHGLARLERMVRWLRPDAICFVGLAGWRAARDTRARPGWQDTRVAGRPVYLMPSTSGLNAGSSLADLTAHLEQARLPPPD